MIGLDTTAIIDLYKGNDAIRKLIETLKEPFAVNYIIYLELMYGLDLTKDKHKNEEEYYDELANSLFNFGLDKKACKKSAEISWKLGKEGKIIGKFDCTVAAVYITNNIKKIITKNKKHFENIKELKVISY